MSASVEVTGLDELEKFLQDMEVSDQTVKKALNTAGKELQGIINNNVAKRSGGSRRSIKRSVRRYSNGYGVIVRVSKWRYNFQEFRSRNSRHKGDVYDAIDKKIDRVVDLAAKEIFSRVKI